MLSLLCGEERQEGGRGDRRKGTGKKRGEGREEREGRNVRRFSYVVKMSNGMATA